MTSSLELLTFETLVGKIEQQKQRARAPDALAGWAKLLVVAQDLAGRSDAGVDPAVGRHWALVRIRVSGYQGIAAEYPLAIELDPTPGITVLHGPNGSGKSGIADAIETALQGRPRVSTAAGRGGNELLWEREHCGRDANEAVIELELLSGCERLKIRCVIDGENRPVEHIVVLYGDGAPTQIDLSKTMWKSALAGHRPVFGYAAIERQVQTAKNLQDFLESLLAFGGCFDTFKQEVDRRGKESRVAEAEWSNALKSAQQKVAEVDSAIGQDDQQGLPAIVWPGVGDCLDAWLSSAELTESGAGIPEKVTVEHYQRLVVAGDEASKALMDLEAAETSLHAQLAGPLKQLYATACEIGDKGSACPVCDTRDVDWFVILGGFVENLAGHVSIEAAMRQKLEQLRKATENDLAAIRTVLAARAQAEDGLLSGEVESAKFILLLDRDGLHATPEIRVAMRKLCAWIQSQECRVMVEDAQRESDRQRQWRRARRAAVDGFLSVWRRVGTDAGEAAAWKSATSCLSTLQQKLREDRTPLLQTHTGTRVHRLLSDAGLSVKSMNVKSTKASIEIVDKVGKEMTLAMLSAGQRNALLLSPLLAASGAGPFGFLVLDDPVHAFDHIRVDCLANILDELAAERRIVVLTHDERLCEHLLARNHATEVRAVRRNPLTGVVTAIPQNEMWDVLLQGAEAILDGSLNPPGGVTIRPTDIVRGLCRQALDNALRQFVIRACVRHGHEPDAHVASLDEESRTKDRLDLVRAMHANDSSGFDAVNAAESFVSGYLRGWNQAAHGNLPDSKATLTEITAAREACKALVRTTS